MKPLMVGLLFIILPIWRVPMIQDGINFFEYLDIMVSKDKPYQHITYEEAVNRAREAHIVNRSL